MAKKRSSPRRMWLLLIPVALVLISARWWPGWYWSWRTDNPVRRGARLAAEKGCLSCHRPTGRDEFANPGSRWGTVPALFRGSAMMYVKSPAEVAAFIRDGHAPGAQAGPPAAPFHMPAFGKLLGKGQIADLAAFAVAADGISVPTRGPVAKGAELSLRFGCESCHGAQGSGGMPNPRSFTGEVPGWAGPDFDDLVRDRDEFGGWVLDGRSARMRHNRLASFFLDRAFLHMPAFRGVLKEEDVDALWTYLEWIEDRGSAAAARSVPPEDAR